jgi:Ricin-type beta-trefoil lectin domain
MFMVRKRKLSGSRWRRVSLAALVPVGALLASLLTVGPAGAVTDTQLYPGYVGPIFGIGSRCVDDSHQSLSDYNPILNWDCNGDWNQQWDYTGSVIVLRNGGGGNTTGCITAGGYKPGSTVFLFPCGDGGQAQVWDTLAGGRLYNPETGMCLDDPANSTRDAQLEVYTCNSGANQVWLGQG